MTYVPFAAQELPNIDGATYITAEEIRNVNDSTGTITGGVISDAGGGTVDVSAADFFVRTVDDVLGVLVSAKLAAVSGQVLTDNSQNYLYASYNGGTPALTVSTTPLADTNRNVILGTVYRAGTTLHITNINIPTTQVDQQLARRLAFVDGIVRQTGGVTTEVGTRQIAITSGTYWLALKPFTLAAIDTSVSDTFSAWYQINSVWTEVTAQTTINNTQYNDITTGLATLANNQYGVHWIFKGLDGDTYVVYGTQSYTLAEAENATVPSALPPHFASGLHVVLVAKIIIQKSAAVFTDIQYPFEQTFSPGAVANHADLGGLSADDHTQYVLADGTRDITGNIRFQANQRVDGQSYQETVTTYTPTGTTQAIDWNNGNVQILDLGSATGDVTLSFTNPPAGAGTLVLKVIQGATARDVILPATALGPGGTPGAKTLDISTADNAEDLVILTKIGGTNYYYEFKQAYA